MTGVRDFKELEEYEMFILVWLGFKSEINLMYKRHGPIRLAINLPFDMIRTSGFLCFQFVIVKL